MQMITIIGFDIAKSVFRFTKLTLLATWLSATSPARATGPGFGVMKRWLSHRNRRSPADPAPRSAAKTLLEFIDAGDVLMVTRIDRLARSIGDLQDIVRALKAKGVALRATEQPIDTSTAAGKAFLDMLGVFAEFETNLRKERQMEGIAKAKAAGVYKGRPTSVDSAKVAELKAQGFGPSQIARKLGIGRASVYRVLAR
jgi:DNA invertase Pin-like site-specific DNA recombinase